MMRKFNIYDEQWIPVEDAHGSYKIVSLRELISNAQNYGNELSTESCLQEISIHRFIAAFVLRAYNVYKNVNNDGFTYDDWKELWNNGKFDVNIMDSYVRSQSDNGYGSVHDMLWLVDDKHPFYQVAGISYENKKLRKSPSILIPEIKSNDSKNMGLFKSYRYESSMDSISYAESVRLLISAMNYGVCGQKDKLDINNLTNAQGQYIGASLACSGTVSLVIGNNLFETILLNLIPSGSRIDYNVNNGRISNAGIPLWEKKTISNNYSKNEVAPDGIIDAYTFMTKRILLIDDDNTNNITNAVVGVSENRIRCKNSMKYESMMPYSLKEDSTTKQKYVVPVQVNQSSNIYGNISSFIVQGSDNIRPAVICFIDKLIDDNMLQIDKYNCNMRTFSIYYSDANKTKIDDIVSSYIMIPSEIILSQHANSVLIVDNIVSIMKEIKQSYNKYTSFINSILTAEGKNNPKGSQISEYERHEFYRVCHDKIQNYVVNINEYIDNNPADAGRKQLCDEIKHDIIFLAASKKNNLRNIVGRMIKNEGNKPTYYSYNTAMTEFKKGIDTIWK